MQETTTKPSSQSYSFLFALLAFLGVGLLLFPIVWLIIDKHFHLYLFSSPPASAWTDDLIMLVTLFLWLILASGAGGYIQALKSKKKPHLFVWFPIAVGLIGTLLMSNMSPVELLIVLGIIGLGVGGSLLGSWLGVRRRKNVRREP